MTMSVEAFESSPFQIIMSPGFKSFLFCGLDGDSWLVEHPTRWRAFFHALNYAWQLTFFDEPRAIFVDSRHYEALRESADESWHGFHERTPQDGYKSIGMGAIQSNDPVRQELLQSAVQRIVDLLSRYIYTLSSQVRRVVAGFDVSDTTPYFVENLTLHRSYDARVTFWFSTNVGVAIPKVKVAPVVVPSLLTCDRALSRQRRVLRTPEGSLDE